VRRYSNRTDLQEQLSQALRRLNEKQAHEAPASMVAAGQASRVWRVRDRLTDDNVCELIERYRAGATARVLAGEFKISHSSVKLVLRQHQVRRKD